MSFRPKPRTSFLTVRVTDSVRKQFDQYASDLEILPSQLLRTLVEALIDQRLVLKPKQSTVIKDPK
ncbi:hypothetical protein UFOVP254_2 [uncultured Caudovirales phage]|uniref:Uncharacterized protein n=1 Tax=uncultured Caudovirales phage TaxID=2100421 RepID=A0A6J5LM63_9CAUD|nr:hypothetical protein UFOVP76_51 [uncultured Caudovirales phage]CAB4132839.1 hypothetical protein UFOVP254_2 [uncultured Caudovirales phage]